MTTETNYPNDVEFYKKHLNLRGMNIYADRGTRVVFSGHGGWDSEAPNAIKDGLVVGQVYTVGYTEVGSWSSDVYLNEFPKQGFNTVMFLEEDDVKRAINPRFEEYTARLNLIDNKISVLQKKRKALLEEMKG